VLRLAACDPSAVARLLAGYGLDLRLVEPGADIPGSYWGDSEAGLQGNTLLARPDTPVHSVLHETAHYVCMTPERRVGLDRDAGGDDDEEHAVCYLQVLLADRVPGFGRERAFLDMDEWGYSFRLGSTRAWFEQDAQVAREWLRARRIVDPHDVLTGILRDR
jgi:L-ascorbate metabolism protein UlaG (beta-lactamase superfamily)